MLIPRHPRIAQASSRLLFVALILLRIAGLSLFIIFLNQTIDLGVSPSLLCTAAALGTLVSSRLAFSRLTGVGFIALILASGLLYAGVSYLLVHIPFGEIFSGYSVAQRLQLAMLAFLVAAISGWTFWRYFHAVTVELVLMVAVTLVIFSGHREFRFDLPKLVNSLAWNFRVEPLVVLVVLGGFLFAGSGAYLFLSTISGRPIAGNSGAGAAAAHRLGGNRFRGLVAMVALAAIALGSAGEVYRYYEQASLTRIANGVGQEDREGLSPLGFHSALGGTNLPAALVRLEGDYAQKNPFGPMLYLRENALSSFNGIELTNASSAYDRDARNQGPRTPMQGHEDPVLKARATLDQSVYLLADHKEAFAVDYPISIAPLKNPNVKRFRTAYRAHSLAPVFPLKDLTDASPGDQRWSRQEWQHYLQPHSDPRYREFAERITHNVSNPAGKIVAMTDYLSKNAIYTLKPGREVKKNEDPVAPFLFGDLRGYCVHFAHATVYMLRALGIPARIGTGYLTDLSQSKDGHILLRMSDRHAWAEAYFSGYGWIPFDTQPERVESHGDSPVDMKTLEELMGLLEPGEEILPPKLETGPLDSEQDQWRLPDRRYLLTAFISLFALVYIYKAFLRYGWLLTRDFGARTRRIYISLSSRLFDLGFERERGETRQEYRDRLRQLFGFEVLSLNEPFERAVYSNPGSTEGQDLYLQARARSSGTPPT